MTVLRLSDGTTTYLSAGLSGLSELASADGDFDFASPEVDDVVLGRVYLAFGWGSRVLYSPPGVIALRRSITEGRRPYLIAEDVGGDPTILETGSLLIRMGLAPRSFLQANTWGIDGQRLPEPFRSRVRQCVIEDHARMLDVLRGGLTSQPPGIVELVSELEGTEAVVLALKSRSGAFKEFLDHCGFRAVAEPAQRPDSGSREELERAVLDYIVALRKIQSGTSTILLLRKRNGAVTLHRIVGMSFQQVFQSIQLDEAAAFLISCNDPLRESWGSVIDDLVATSTWVF